MSSITPAIRQIRHTPKLVAFVIRSGVNAHFTRLADIQISGTTTNLRKGTLSLESDHGVTVIT